MANTYTSLYYHLIFSTKNRNAWIRPEIQENVWAYIGGIARHHRLTALQIGGMQDHLHALVMAPATLAPSRIAQYLKGDSSKWIHEEYRDLMEFAWQEGYGAFTVSKSNLPDVVAYIRNQHVHHQKRSFQDEYREFLQKNGIGYEEQYLWG